MVHGHTPIELSIDGSGGHVQFPDGVDEEEAAVIGLMGGCAVMQILGTDADCDASASDCQFLASLYAHGNRNSIDRIIRGRADWLVSQHATAIVDMANEVLRRPSTSRLTHSVHLSKDDIGEIVRSDPEPTGVRATVPLLTTTAKGDPCIRHQTRSVQVNFRRSHDDRQVDRTGDERASPR